MPISFEESQKLSPPDEFDQLLNSDPNLVAQAIRVWWEQNPESGEAPTSEQIKATAKSLFSPIPKTGQAHAGERAAPEPTAPEPAAPEPAAPEPAAPVATSAEAERARLRAKAKEIEEAAARGDTAELERLVNEAEEAFRAANQARKERGET